MHHIANKARYWTEKIAREHGFRADLCGLCAVGASRTFHLLKQAGYTGVKIQCNWQHAWVKAGEFLVDVTASQFNYPDVFITDDWPADHYYRPELTFRKLRTFVHHQHKAGWRPNQIYDYYVDVK